MYSTPVRKSRIAAIQAGISWSDKNQNATDDKLYQSINTKR